GAEASWKQALITFEKLAAEHKDVADYQGSIGMVLGNLGWLLLQRDRPAEARDHLDRAIGHTRAALGANPRHPTHRQALRDQHEYLADALVRLGEHAWAAAVAQRLPAVLGNSPADRACASRLLARCVTAAEKDRTLAEPVRTATASRYARLALD